MGKSNGDHWNLYVTEPSVTHPQTIPNSLTQEKERSNDMTIEILMTNLLPDTVHRFYQRPDEKPGLVGGQRVEAEIGLDTLLPTFQLDSYLFPGCGYSANGISPEGHYLTVHVTPEIHCSFASFETNVPLGTQDGRGLHDLVSRVVDIFCPGSLSVTVFRSDETDDRMVNTTDLVVKPLADWKRKDRIVYELDGYLLGFSHFSKVDITPGTLS